MLTFQGVSYTHPNKEPLFTGLHLHLQRQDKVALIGNNGSGKSTLLQLMAGSLLPAKGAVKTEARPYYLPQFHDDDQTVARALDVEDKLRALREILAGNATGENLLTLDDDWTLEERVRRALAHWSLEDVDLRTPLWQLSGGQQTKVFLAGIFLHAPEIVLLDEPSNHLDALARQKLYEYISASRQTLVVVSHDRSLLNLLDKVYVLDERGLTAYGGNYDFYLEQRRIEQEALREDLREAEKALRKARETERAALERQQKLDARGKKKQEKAGLPTISMNTFKNKAENSTARLKGAHTEKVDALGQDVRQIRKALPDEDRMKMALDDSSMHKRKLLITARGLNLRDLWPEPLDIQLFSRERIALKGPNGSGKTSLLKLLLGYTRPTSGTIERTTLNSLYLDQDYSLLQPALTVYGQACLFNTSALEEHEVKSRLTRFLFTQPDWDKRCNVLSGGERMRLALCALTIGGQAPDLVVLDEPTNNLDIRNIEILTSAINAYEGAILVVSHDELFLKDVRVEKDIYLPSPSIPRS